MITARGRASITGLWWTLEQWLFVGHERKSLLLYRRQGWSRPLPFRAAFRRPAITRSTMRLRSSSATAPSTVKTILPAGVEVSRDSLKDTKSIPSS